VNWLTLLVTLFIQAMVAMALLTLPVMAPVVSKALHVSPALVGLYVSVTYIGAMFSSLISGTAVSRWGAIRVSQIGLLLSAAGLLLCAMPWLPTVALGALLIGLGYGPITPASSHLLARTTPPHQMSLVFSIKQTGVPLGAMLAGAIVPQLLLRIDWQWSMVSVAVVCALFAGISQRLRANMDDDRKVGQTLNAASLIRPIRLVMGHRLLMSMAACSFVFSMVQMSLTTYLVTFLHEKLSYGLVAAGLALSLTQMGGVVGRIGWGFVSDRWLGASRALLLLAVVMALCALATAYFTPAVPTWMVLSVLTVFGASAIGWNGVYLSEVARQAPEGQASMATGGTLAFTFLGVVVGPMLFGVISNTSGGYSLAFMGLTCIASLAAGLLLFIFRKR
jgi:predicted MFS family arabinose efflux permease